MAIMTIHSTNPNFSYLIKKNPDSGMTVKQATKFGVIFGWYSDNQSYHIYFRDKTDKSSFSRNDFKYIDHTEYSSPLFVPVAVRELLSSAFKQDSEASSYITTVEVLNVEIRKFSKIESVLKYYNITTTLIPQTREFSDYQLYSLKLTTTKSLYYILRVFYVVFFAIAGLNDFFYVPEENQIHRIAESLNVIDAPYYLRYLIKSKFIKNSKMFKELKSYFETSDIKMTFGSNMETRMNYIKSELLQEDSHSLVLIDFGAGEGSYLSFSKYFQYYVAVERESSLRNIIQKKVEQRALDNVSVVSSFSEFISVYDYIVLMTEVIEHNTKDEVKEILNQFINDHHCKRIYITTPNRDFNKFYATSFEYRHEDHKFEFNEIEAEDFFSQLHLDHYSIEPLGDTVNGISTSFFIELSTLKV